MSGKLTTTPSKAMIAARVSAGANVFVDYKFVVDRASLSMTGSWGMPGWYEAKFMGSCKVQKADTSRNKF